MLDEAAQILLAPACVVAVSIAGRRWGPTVAGILGTLPVVAGPILLILALQHGHDFAATAAEGSVLGLIALTAFVVVYGLAATRFNPTVSLVCGWGGFFVFIATLAAIDPPLSVAVPGVAAAFVVGLRMLPIRSAEALPTILPPWWDLPVRGLAALALVVTLMALSETFGPTLSGLLTPFPIIASVLAFFVHSHSGSSEVRMLLRGFLVGFWSFAAFCLTLALSLPAMSMPLAFVVATTIAVAVQALTFLVRTRRLEAA